MTSFRSHALVALAVTVCASLAQAQGTIRVRNNHDLPFRGPVRFATTLPDGSYGPAAEVRGGVARAVVELAPKGDVLLDRTGALGGRSFAAGPLGVAARAGGVDLRWGDRPLGSIELELAVRPGTTATPEDVAPRFRALDVAWKEQADGTLRGDVRQDGYALALTLAPYGGGWVDMTARLTRVDAPGGPAYVALVRRVTTPGVRQPRLRFNGRVVDGAVSPDTWDRDFWYVRGVDWTSWTANGLSLAAVNGFTPAPTIRRAHRDSAWVEGSHFYVWERTRRDGDHVYLISEVAGPNPGQEKSRYMPVTPYAPMRQGDVVELEWRLAVEPSPAAGWEESQLRTFAGYRSPAHAGDGATLDLGVAGVQFGTAYFPYSTLNENFDFYRTPGLDRESFWAFSPALWKRWRTLAPRMRSDMHIARAMGFAWVRMHHLELLQSMDRAEALAFLDFYMQTARELGLQVVVDSEGPAEWLALVAGRYRDVVKRVELENEILIYGIKQGDAERWTSMYRAVKAVAPETQVFLTSAGNHGMFERLRTLKVPFDRVGLHAYKHGPQWKESFGSHVLGTADYASDLGLPMTLGEFNWKELTLLSPEARRPEFVDVYERVLENRAVPEFMHFQFQESLSFNPSVSGGFTRHYEPLATDRRPKPEAFELMRLIAKYGPADAPVNALPVLVREVRVANGSASAAFTVTNNTAAPLTVRLRALAFDGLASRLASPASLTLQPGERRDGQVELRLANAATVGTYHHFVAAEYDGRTNYGWGVAANMGAPTFSAASVLGARATYPQGVGVLKTIAWDRPVAVAYGAKASVIELEMAYQIMNTLQSATGRPVRLSSVADLPDSLRRDATLVLVGTPESNALVPADAVPNGTPAATTTKGAPATPGVLAVRPAEGRGQWLLLTGRDRGAAQAAAVDFILRYWPNAKDAMMRTTGMERGAALGNRAGGATNADLP